MAFKIGFEILACESLEKWTDKETDSPCSETQTAKAVAHAGGPAYMEVRPTGERESRSFLSDRESC
jgi:hypothetical protein